MASSRLCILAVVVLVACARVDPKEEEAWTRAAQASGWMAYGSYLEEYPAGTHSADARKRIEDLKWKNITEQHVSSETITRFLDEFPQSVHIADARNKLEETRRTELSSAAGKCEAACKAHAGTARLLKAAGSRAAGWYGLTDSSWGMNAEGRFEALEEVKLLDPWGNQWEMRAGETSARVRSAGPDHSADTNDDVTCECPYEVKPSRKEPRTRR